MWIFTVYGFFSVTALPEDRTKLMIRARSKQHLENLQGSFRTLKPFTIQRWPGRDYQFRIIVPNTVWQEVMQELVAEINWNNFKDECGKRFGKGSKFIGLLHRVWGMVLNTYPKGSMFDTRRATQVSSAMRGYDLHPDDLAEYGLEDPVGFEGVVDDVDNEEIR